MLKYHSYWLMGASVWGSIIGAGFFGIYCYETTPGPSGPAPPQWPSYCSVRPDSERFTLVMALHPKCPCSRASVRELIQILAQFPNAVTAYVLIYEPREESAGWRGDDLDPLLEGVPGLRVVRDGDARIARSFGAETSGHVLLFAPDETLVFSGGITRGRGQDGTSPGQVAIGALLRGGRSSVTNTSVFGCRLVDPGTP